MSKVLDDKGDEVAVITNNDEFESFSDTPNGRMLQGWSERGVRRLKGVEAEGGLMLEKEVMVRPDNFLFNLAILEEIERRGWVVTDA